MRTAKLSAWRDAELDRLASVLHESMLAWARAWGLAIDTDARVGCAPADDQDLREWQPMGTCAAPAAWVHWSDLARLRWRSLFGAGAISTAVTSASASACEEDAAWRLARALHIDADANTDADPMPPCGKWSGAAVATLPCGSRVLVTSACIQRVLKLSAGARGLPRPTLPSLSPVLEAAGRCETRVEARLADCDLDLAMLQRLQIGDVIRLPHPLTDPLGVHVTGNRPLFAGFLARSGAYRALELVSKSV